MLGGRIRRGRSCPLTPAPFHGSPTRGSLPRGSPARGSSTRGSPARGSSTRGSPARGSPTSGSPARGSPARGSPAHGSPTLGSRSAWKLWHVALGTWFRQYNNHPVSGISAHRTLVLHGVPCCDCVTANADARGRGLTPLPLPCHPVSGLCRGPLSPQHQRPGLCAGGRGAAADVGRGGGGGGGNGHGCGGATQPQPTRGEPKS